MPQSNPIAAYLDEVHRDWQSTYCAFPKNIYLKNYWPIPFFGNPRNAVVATIGINPSSGEFAATRRWNEVKGVGDWKRRLRDYFKCDVAPHKWFESWRIGLALLGTSHETGGATHIDVSYRPTKAMIRDSETDPKEFRLMVERDVVWLFKLIPLCPKLRVLLTFGPVVTERGGREGLHAFLLASASKHGFKAIKVETRWFIRHEPTRRKFLIHDADAEGENGITRRVVKNLQPLHGIIANRI